MQEEERRNYYAIIPATVRYDKSIPPNAKLLYGEITALCNQEGYCWATNEYFAKLYGCGRQAISRWLSKLKERGYVNVEIRYKSGSKQIDHRYITICEYPIVIKDEGYSQKSEYPIVENATENITCINTTKNNTSNKKKERKSGYDDILSSIEDTSLKDLYLEYIKMRKLIKSPMTDRALEMLMHKVESLETDVERQKKLLEVAIINNWKSVYPLKGDEGNGLCEANGHAPVKAEGIIRL